MSTLTHTLTKPNLGRAIWLAMALAIVAALSYVLMALDLLGVGDLAPEEAPATIVYVAAGCYVLGGLLILLRRRWLWIVGALINALVIFAFVSFYINRPAVLFSPGGLASKIAQLLLEAVLVYLIVADRRRERRAA